MKILTKKKQDEMMQALMEMYLIGGDCIRAMAGMPGGADFMKIAGGFIKDAMTIADGLAGKRGSYTMIQTNRITARKREKGELPKFPFGIHFPEEGTEEEWERHMKEYNEYRLKKREEKEGSMTP